MTSKPIQPQTVSPTIEYSAPLELSRNPTGPNPSFESAQPTIPYVGSNSQRKMITVAIVETTTGTNTAVRYQRIPRILRLSATATSNPPVIEIGTNSAV